MNLQMNLWFAAALFAGLMPVRGADGSQPPAAMNLTLTSTAFTEGQAIPAQYTCQGGDSSPALAWTGTPANTKSFALIADDPDAPAGTWVHWVIYDLPSTTRALPENVAKQPVLEDNSKQGLNDFQRVGYGGPCPPAGKPHRYYFKLFALDEMLYLKPGATKKDVELAMKGHILAEGQLMGTYQRK